jgi:transcriptional regulator with XRE-family HTH domain
MAARQIVSFGEQLRRHREAAGLTQEELAERAGLTAKGISALERGERQRPYQYTVRKLAEALALAPPDRDFFEAAARGRGLPSSSSPREDAPPCGDAPARPGDTLTPLVGRADASRLLEECRAMAEVSGDIQARRIVQGALAELDLLEGRPAAAYARLVPLLDRPGMEEWQVTELLPLLAWAHLAASEVKKATDVVAQAIVRARANPSSQPGRRAADAGAGSDRPGAPGRGRAQPGGGPGADTEDGLSLR